MHTTIAIPDDVPVVTLAKAMATIGLHAVHGYHTVLTFDHGAPARGLPATCDVAGCDRLATTRDGDKTICARHWLASRTGF
jgi:hypothetical protein